MHALIFKLVRFRYGVVALMMSIMGHFASSGPTDGNQASFTENQPFCSSPNDMRSPSVLIHLLFPNLAETWIMALCLVNCHTRFFSPPMLDVETMTVDPMMQWMPRIASVLLATPPAGNWVNNMEDLQEAVILILKMTTSCNSSNIIYLMMTASWIRILGISYPSLLCEACSITLHEHRGFEVSHWHHWGYDTISQTD